MTKKKVFIFVYNSFHQLMAISILKSGVVSEDSYVLDHHSIQNKELKTICNYIFIGKNNFIKFYKILSWRFLILKFLRKNEIEEVLIPHLEGVLPNFLFDNLPENVKISLFHEGVLSLYEFNRGKRNWFRFRKNIFPLFFLYRFKRHENIFPVNHPSIYRFFTPLTSETTLKDKNKLVKIDLNEFKFKGIDKQTALILGTPLVNINSFILSNISLTIIHLLQKKNIKNVIYKPHPVEYDSPLLKVFPNDFSLELLDKRSAIEQLTQNLSPAVVISFASSSLINLIESNRQVEFYSIFFKEFNEPNLYAYFEKIGVKILNI